MIYDLWDYDLWFIIYEIEYVYSKTQHAVDILE